MKIKIIEELIKDEKFNLDYIYAAHYIFFHFSRFFNKRRGIGIGPEPLINNVFHKRALEKYNFDVETFSVRSYYITNKFDHIFEFPLCSYYSFFRSLFLYECLYMYFNGCLIFKNSIFENLEPYLFKIAGVKTVIMPYGSDVQDLSRSNNLLYKNAVFKDAPHTSLMKGIYLPGFLSGK